MGEDSEEEFGDENSGEKEESGIYTEEGREELIDEEDEITDIEEGFMKGYDEGERAAVCANCGIVLEDKVVEGVIDDKTYRFCSEECASEFGEKRKE